MSSKITQVVIVGGGSAGWLTAGYLAATHGTNPDKKLSITLIESPDVSTIGVGEGTWPSMRSTLEKIGISEAQFITCCDASFKQASKFVNWRNNSADDSYYHPFTVPEGYTQVDVHHLWRQQNSQSFAELTAPQVALCEQYKAPKQQQTPEYAGVTTYGYHLDSGKFAQLLQRHCTEILGVSHVQAHMTSINNDELGNINELVLQEQDNLSGDLFIDCTGMRSLLLGEHFNVPVINQEHVLFNNSALATQVEYESPDSPIASATLSTAQTAGWIWDIGLPTRRGVGHTYSSKYISDEQAEVELRDYIAQSRGEEYSQSLTVRKISFTPGYRQQFWKNNCLAIGMSSGFIEPLEASALAMVELSIKMLSEEFPTDNQHMAMVSERFNQRFSYRWQRVIEFLKLHYVLSERNDTAYWRDNRLENTIPGRLKELMALWKYQPPSRHDFIQNEEVFPSASYQFVLYGMGFETALPSHQSDRQSPQRAARLHDHCITKTEQLLKGLTTNRELLNAVKAKGFGPVN